MIDRKELLKRFLGQYKKAKRRKHLLESRLKDLKLEMNMPISAVRYTDMPKGSGISEGASTLAVRKIELEERISNQEELMIDTMNDVMTVVEHLPSTSEERQIIEYRYIDDYSWAKIEREIGYSRSVCFEKFGRGLEKLLEFRSVNDILNEYVIELECGE